jgi:hypothetical protein
MILLAVAAHSALKPPKNAPTVSASIPSAAEMDSLSKYLSPRAARGVPVLATGNALRAGQPDPFFSMDVVTTSDSLNRTVPRPAVRDRYVVTAILISNNKRIAVINEALVTVGSMLPGGFRVTAIENDHVEIVAPSGVSRMLAIRESNP